MSFDAVMDALGSDEITAHIETQNVNSAVRLDYNDHGTQHIGIVRDRALELLELLRDEVEFGVYDHELGFGYEEARVVVACAATLHDVGHLVHREKHTNHSLILADDLLDDVLGVYDTRERVALKSEALHAIYCHHSGNDPLTPEAGVVRVADALDMTQGRSRLPYNKGERSIDTVSSQAIEDVTVHDGEDEFGVPVLVEIGMTNSAGVYQIDSLLKKKLHGSGLEDYVRIVAVNEGNDDIVGRLEL
ncbi:MAG: metal-dependent HD superfamily phosphatase/phosphodiesterase [Methanobacteriota archaeon]|jgi:metal-dependent HD superfamily phosphatase/phosphodiesterase|uniref:HD domain-containing protein n=1 Tax=Halorutilus salinus TaxID=2487751 RepID=A0A9Q4GHH4_9EURY|nr:HD domain-containing protein [Halorutilus salinus]MCX2818795.1 HD domain-containing protein [Halorutilus salinus]